MTFSKHHVAAPLAAAMIVAPLMLGGCAGILPAQNSAPANNETPLAVEDKQASANTNTNANVAPEPEPTPAASAEQLKAQLNLTEDYRASFVHGEKGAAYQKYIVLHDTEGNADAASVVDYWDGNGNLVAAHFVVNKDGSIVQCVPLDKIAHHSGYGDAGHNDLFGIVEDGRDDMLGAVPIGSAMPDYGMNAWSVGIEMVHVGGSGDYPEAQLEALDKLIAYIDAYFGFQSVITDHNDWRTGNSDTSAEFQVYMANYADHRTHN